MPKIGLVLTMLLGGLAADAAAAPLLWHLNAQEQGPGFPGSGPITGFFTYDATTGFSSSWNFRQGGSAFLSGPFPPTCPPGECRISSSSFDPGTHSVAYQTCLLAGGICYPTEIATASGNFDNTFSFSVSGHQELTVLRLDLTLPLTDAGGTIPLIPAATCVTPGAPPECDPNSPGSYIGGHAPAGLFFLTPLTGYVAAVPAVVPEPGSVLYVSLGVAILAARRRRFSKASQWRWHMPMPYSSQNPVTNV